MGNEAFSCCDSLEKIEVDSNNNNYASIDGVLFDKDKSKLIVYPNSHGTTYKIPNSVTSIGEGAFYGCTSLTSVTIPNSVTSIGKLAFYYCDSLESITIPSGVTSIENYAFYGCESLEKIEVDSNNKNYASIDGVLFDKGKTTLIRYPEGKNNTTYEIPNSVTSIGNGAFDWCTNLESITIPSGVTSIGNYAFDDCSSLIFVIIPDSVTSIGKGAFLGCESLTAVYYKGSEKEWDTISIGEANESLINATIHYK
jgi:hypothetical protein